MSLDVDVSELLGKTITKIDQGEADVLVFHCADGQVYRMFHSQDCCEHVSLNDVSGVLGDLIGSPITKSEMVISDKNPPGVSMEYQDSFTWTFYHFATAKGYVTLRWYGESNGYYSESVDFVRIE